jgi:hypothetical protein
MNQSAERHLTKAETYLGKGEAWYRKAGAEIAAAKEAGATWTEIGDRLDRSKSWCQKVIAWAESPANAGSVPTPFTEPGREPTDVRGAKRVLREAPLEQVEQIISALPKERQQAIAAATGDRYAGRRQEHDERERGMTPAQRKEREAAGEEADQHVANLMSGFDHLNIATNLRVSTDILKEMIAKNTLTSEGLSHIDQALAEFLDEYKVAQAAVGQEVT